MGPDRLQSIYPVTDSSATILLVVFVVLPESTMSRPDRGSQPDACDYRPSEAGTKAKFGAQEIQCLL
jgi:hypothetical protein